MLRILFLLGTFVFLDQVIGQTSIGGIPQRMQKRIKSDSVIIDMLPLDTLKIINEEDSSINSGLKGYRFAYNYPVDISPSNSGTWYKPDDNSNVWSVTIRSKNAFAIGLVFNNYKLKKNEKIFVYTRDEVLGAYTNENNLSNGIFPIVPLNGEVITVEYTTPYETGNRGSFFIEKVAHVYKNILQEPGACNIDINCPEGADWQVLKKAICKLVIYKTGYSELCSGTLMNNTALDAKPYVLTAQHCLFDNSDAARTVFYFNYESPSCNGPKGNQIQTISGSVVRSTIYDYDFTLLELYNHPPMGFKPYLAGWSLETAENLDTATSIHHPWGGNKKIAVSNSHPSIGTYVELGSPAYATNAFWLIRRWDHGVTEKGSSGGPLFDLEHRVVGTLTGGDAVCGNPVNDYFERLVVSYSAKATPSQQLKFWLDPLNLDVTHFDGYDPFPFVFSGCDTISNIGVSESVKILPYEYGKGYYSGHNSDSISKFAEKFHTYDSLYLSGVQMNINRTGSIGGLIVRLYEGNIFPETILYETYVPYSSLTANAVNYIEFYPKITVRNNYFVGYEITYQASDTFTLYQASPRYLNGINTAYLFANNSWVAMNNYTVSGWGTSFDIRPIICNTTTLITGPIKKINELNVYPSPASKTLNISVPFNLEKIKNIEVFNLTGARFNPTYSYKNSEIELNLIDLLPGFYITKLSTESAIYTAKFIKAR